jgi:hypothetical protein
MNTGASELERQLPQAISAAAEPKTRRDVAQRCQS